MRLSLQSNKNTSTQDEKDYFVYLHGTAFMSPYFKKTLTKNGERRSKGEQLAVDFWDMT